MQHGCHAVQTDTRKIPGTDNWHDFTHIQTYKMQTQHYQCHCQHQYQLLLPAITINVLHQ